jgi:hypothetical protein
LGGAVDWPFAGFEREDQVVADDGRDAWPGGRYGATKAFAVAGGADAGHADADTVWCRWELIADRSEQGGEFLAVKELEIAGPDGERGEHGIRAFDQQG